jgi:hypothetical protein
MIHAIQARFLEIGADLEFVFNVHDPGAISRLEAKAKMP